MKSSLPKALCLMLNGRCSDATTLRVSLETGYASSVQGYFFISDVSLIVKGTFYKYIYVCNEHIPAQQAHEVAGCVGVETERRNNDVGGSMNPVLMVILHPIQHCMSYCGLCMDHLPCRDRTERKQKRKLVCYKKISVYFISSPLSKSCSLCFFLFSFIATHLAS